MMTLIESITIGILVVIAFIWASKVQEIFGNLIGLSARLTILQLVGIPIGVKVIAIPIIVKSVIVILIRIAQTIGVNIDEYRLEKLSKI